jgi:hypothetical protein
MLCLHPPISLVVATSLTGGPQHAFLVFFQAKPSMHFAKSPQAGAPWPQYPSVAVLGTMNQTVTTVPAAKLDIRCSFLGPYLYEAPNVAS